MALQQPPLVGIDATDLFEDHSGLISKCTNSTPENPFDILIDACGDDPALIQTAYETHRSTRNAKQRANLLSPNFKGIIVEKVLQELEYAHGVHPIPELEGTKKRMVEEIDPRHCLVFWARPTDVVRNLIGQVQEKLKEIAPDIWLMPRDNLHMTVLEITHSQTPEVISRLVSQMRSSLEKIVSWPQSPQHRAVLVKPMLSYDTAALAVSFIPAAEGRAGYTYHHLRRDFYKLSVESRVVIASRYTVPSAHITVARFVTEKNRVPGGECGVEEWVERIQKINKWLGEEWGKGMRWVVGEERGVDCRMGSLWYGGGESVAVGQGF